jgi:hypothetical protein
MNSVYKLCSEHQTGTPAQTSAPTTSSFETQSEYTGDSGRDMLNLFCL